MENKLKDHSAGNSPFIAQLPQENIPEASLVSKSEVIEETANTQNDLENNLVDDNKSAVKSDENEQNVVEPSLTANPTFESNEDSENLSTMEPVEPLPINV